jgi:hypothetical protein
MDDLKFENQLLKAEIAAVRFELQAANEKQRVQNQGYAALSSQVKEIETVKNRVKILQQENTRLCNALIQTEAEEVEIKKLRGKIAELEHTIKNYRESDHEKEMGNLAKLMMKQDNIIRGLNKDVRASESEKNRLKEENKALAQQRGLSQIRKQKNNKPIGSYIVPFILGGCSAAGVIIVVSALRMIF